MRTNKKEASACKACFEKTSNELCACVGKRRTTTTITADFDFDFFLFFSFGTRR